ncbi:MAG: hypothetical protein AB7Q17_17700 [Phycisphaerae bacterium]
MKLALLAESSYDEKSLGTVLTGALGAGTAPAAGTPVARNPGWPAVLNILPNVVRAAYFNSDGDALVVLADGNGDTLHTPAHNSVRDPLCRVCMLRQAADAAVAGCVRKPRPAGVPLRVGIAVAYPAIEAWYLCGERPEMSEAHWARFLAQNPSGVTERKRQLKRLLYGTDRPSTAQIAEKSQAAAARLAANITPLVELFPMGFGAMFHDLTSWPAAGEDAPSA